MEIHVEFSGSMLQLYIVLRIDILELSGRERERERQIFFRFRSKFIKDNTGMYS